MPTAKGSIGTWYATFLEPDMDVAIQKVAFKLSEKNQLWDSRRKRFVHPVHGRVPGYCIAKYALQLLLKQNGYDGELVKPDAELRAQKIRKSRTVQK
jgi:hypothetical protein